MQHTVIATIGKVITQKNTILTECEDDLRPRTEKYDWQTSNLIFASFFGICIIGGLLMRPLGTNRPLLWPTTWAQICKHLRSPGIDSNESIPPAYVVRRAGTITLLVVPARHARLHRLAESNPGVLKRLQIRAQVAILSLPPCNPFKTYSHQQKALRKI